MKYMTEMGSSAMMYEYIPSFITIGSDIQKLIGGGIKQRQSMVIT
jgi:hypothetical protein